MLLSVPKAGIILRITTMFLSRAISFLKNMGIEPCPTSGTVSKVRQEFRFCFSLSYFFYKIINLPNLKAFHVLIHCSHWHYSQNVSVFPSDFIITIFQHIPWLTSLLFLSLIINCPLVLRCVLCF